MESNKAWAPPSPWVPMKDPVDVKHLGKLLEELNECGAAVARCLIQGIDEAEPVTGKPNRQWLQDEVADVIANIELCAERFNLNTKEVDARVDRKQKHLRAWHAMTPPASGGSLGEGGAAGAGTNYMYWFRD